MINISIIQVRLVDEPELKNKDDIYYCQFTVACQRDRNREVADFIDCVAFGTIADNLSKYIHKGDKLTVCGSLETSIYKDDKNTSRKSYSLKCEKIYYPEKQFKIDDYSDIDIPTGE